MGRHRLCLAPVRRTGRSGRDRRLSAPAHPTFSPFRAAGEGLRVLRREPKAVLSWIGIWLAALIVLGIVQLLNGRPQNGAAPPASVLDLMRRFGPLWPVIVPTLLGLWIMTTATVFRAVIRPEQHGWHLLKLGADEGRLAIVTAAGFAAVVLFGSGPAVILLFLFRPLLAVAPRLAGWTVMTGALATVGVEIWIGVRLSLTPVHAFADRGFHLVGYWRLTRRVFWRLLGCYVLVFIQIAVLLALLGLTALGLGAAAMALIAAQRVDWIDRAAALLVALGVALGSAVLFVGPLLLLAACQASAYRAIMAAPRDRPAAKAP